MDELMRGAIHEAFAADEPPAGLRSRVIAAVPMDTRRGRRQQRRPALRAQWATGFAAILLTAALVAALVYSRVGQPGPSHPPPKSSDILRTSRLSAPEGIAVAPDGTVYISDYVGNRVYRIQQDGSLVIVAGGGSLYEGPATKSNIFGPAGLAFAGDGDLYIADNLGSAVRRVDRNGTLSTFVTGHSGGLSHEPLGVAFDPAGVLYVGGLGGDVVAVKPDGSMSRIDLSGIPAPIVYPGNVAVDPAGNLYVADRSPATNSPGQVPVPAGGCRVIRVAPDRSVSVVAGTGTCGYSGDGGPASKAQIDDPNGIAFDSAGNLYFADSNNHRIRRIDTHGIITTIAGTGVEGHGGDGGSAVKAELAYPSGEAMVQDRYLYVADSCGCMDPAAYGAVRLIDLRSGTIRTVVSSNSRVTG